MRGRSRNATSPLADLLAARRDSDGGGEARTFLAFEAGEILYAVEAAAVEIVVRRRFVAPVPTGPPELLGVASVHGRMRLVIDLARSGDRPGGANWWLVVLHGDARLAIVADRIIGLQAAGADSGAAGGEVEIRCGERLARVFDPERILDL